MGSANILTDKQEKFVQGLMKGLSQREAYKQAYSTSKMKESTIDEKACILLKNDKVRARFEDLHGKVIAKAEEETIADAIEIMKLWTRISRGKEKDNTVVQEQEPIIGDDGKKKGYRTVSRVMEIPPSIKDRIKASELLGKRYGLDKAVKDMEDNKFEIEMVDADED